MDCIFCKIASGEIKTPCVYKDEHAVVFRDLHPKAPTHLLIVPREHIASIQEVDEENSARCGHLLLVARRVGEQLGLEGYKLAINVGKAGGQEIFHLHIHLLAQ